jgi:hypothetical protein
MHGSNAPSTSRRVFAGVLGVALTLAVVVCLSGCKSPGAPPTVPVAPAPSASQPASSTTATASTSKTTSASIDASASEVCGCAVGTTLTVTGSGMKSDAAGKPSEAAALSAAKSLLAKNEEAVLTSSKVDSMARDKKGKWWVLISANEESAGAVKAVLYYDGKKWDERAYGLTITDTDLPSDVKF